MSVARPGGDADVVTREQYVSAFDNYRDQVEENGGSIIDVAEDPATGLYTWGAQVLDGDVIMLERCYSEHFRAVEKSYVRQLFAERYVKE